MTDVSGLPSRKHADSVPFLYNFFYIAASLSLLLFLIVAIIWYSLAKNEKRTIANDERNQITLGSEAIGLTFDDIISDMHMFAGLTSLCDYCAGTDKDNLRLFTGSFYEVGKYQYKYDQMRIVDSTGDELVRINQNDRIFSLTPDSLLQNKSDRYYFQTGMKLKPGEIYVSPFDLNIDAGVIENKPVIRFVTPIIDPDGNMRGIVVLNYLGRLLHVILDELEFGTENHIQLLDTDGYWLYSHDPSLEWGFMYDDRQDVSFARRYPDEWTTINASMNGQFETSNGLFTFIHLYPLANLTHASPQSFPQYDTYSWILLSHVPHNELSWLVLSFFRPFIIFAVLLEVFIIISALLFSQAEIRRKYALNVLRQAADTDPLTGLLNRRRFTERFIIELARYRRMKKPFSIIIADIDRFKSLNDTFGHNTGDIVLRTIADIFSRNLRDMDIVGRWGGEEFLILLPDTDGTQAVLVAEKLRASIFNTGFPDIGESQQVSASFGVCEINDEHELHELVKKADEALYHAKNTGRNKVALHTRS